MLKGAHAKLEEVGVFPHLCVSPQPTIKLKEDPGLFLVLVVWFQYGCWYALGYMEK